MNNKDLKKLKLDCFIANYHLILLDKSIHTITVSKMSQKLKVNRNLFYKYYNSLDDFEFEYACYLSDCIFKYFDNNFLYVLPIGNMNSLFSIFDKLFLKYKDLFEIIIKDKRCENILKKIKENLLNKFVEKLKLIGNNKILSPKFYFNFVIDGIIGVLKLWYKTNKNMQLNQLIVVIISIVNKN